MHILIPTYTKSICVYTHYYNHTNTYTVYIFVYLYILIHYTYLYIQLVRPCDRSPPRRPGPGTRPEEKAVTYTTCLV